MINKRFVAGVILFFGGGAVLAFGSGGPSATGVGTTVGLAGLILLGWAWLGRESAD